VWYPRLVDFNADCRSVATDVRSGVHAMKSAIAALLTLVMGDWTEELSSTIDWLQSTNNSAARLLVKTTTDSTGHHVLNYWRENLLRVASVGWRKNSSMRYAQVAIVNFIIFVYCEPIECQHVSFDGNSREHLDIILQSRRCLFGAWRFVRQLRTQVATRYILGVFVRH
jgi:hypothetical protein